jgi:hypothetical protein
MRSAHYPSAAAPEKKSGLSIANLFGLFLFLGGLGLAAYFWLFFDTTVPADGGERVHNVGLLNDRSTGTFIGGFAVLLGVIIAIFGGQSRS